MPEINKTESRKKDHIDICSSEDVDNSLKFDVFADIDLVYKCLPDMNFGDVDTHIEFLGKELKAPILISSMTGGTEEAEIINKRLAKVAEELGVAFAVGSQRAALEDESLAKTYQIRDVAPKTIVIGNIGAVQLLKNYTKEHVKKAADMISADAIYLHINPLQEACQTEGDTNFKDMVSAIDKITKTVKTPVIVKEVGCGIDKDSAHALEKAGVRVIDVAGMGGTSWPLVESKRNENKVGETFRCFGIPTPISLIETKQNVEIPVIASGGIRNGLQAAKAIALGADVVGIALPLLKPSRESEDAVKKWLSRFIQELRVAMFSVGAKTVADLQKKPVIITGKTRSWLRQRGVKLDEYGKR